MQISVELSGNEVLMQSFSPKILYLRYVDLNIAIINELLS